MHGRDLDSPLQPRRFVRTLIAFTPTRIFFIMRFYVNIAALALATSTLSPTLSAPTLHPDLLSPGYPHPATNSKHTIFHDAVSQQPPSSLDHDTASVHSGTTASVHSGTTDPLLSAIVHPDPHGADPKPEPEPDAGKNETSSLGLIATSAGLGAATIFVSNKFGPQNGTSKRRAIAELGEGAFGDLALDK